VFEKTRLFLKSQADVQLVDWLDLASSQAIAPRTLNNRSGRFLMVWQNDTLLIQEGDFLLPQPSSKKSYVHKVAGHNWIISEDCTASTCVVLGIQDTQRKMLVRMLVVLIFIPLLIIFILTMLAIYIAVSTTLNPLNQLADTVSKTSPDKLGYLPEDGQSKELRPLISALNQLIENMRLQLNKERQFLDTCAHELRTPITALVAHIQSIESVSKTSNKQYHQIQQSALRTVRVANQFLGFARNRNSTAKAAQGTSFDLCELVRQIIADQMHEHTHFRCQMYGVKRVPVIADMFALELAIRNIIENSIKYGVRDGTEKITMRITVCLDRTTTTIVFEDSGPGVKPAFRTKILERFYRLPTQKTPGAGLGLTIVQETAQRYAGTVLIDQSKILGGLQVSMSMDTGVRHQNTLARNWQDCKPGTVFNKANMGLS